MSILSAAVTTTSVTTLQGVVVSIDAATGAYSYTPPLNYSGRDSFEYVLEYGEKFWETYADENHTQ